MSKKNYKHKKRKIKYKNVFKFFLFVAILFIVFKIIIDMPITNIYIEGNSIYKDQEIIELAKLEDYPSSIKNNSFIVKKRLKDSGNFTSVKVTKVFGKVYISVTENRPVFYNSNTSKVVMLDKSERDGDVVTPYLLNYVPDTVYPKFVDAMCKVNPEILTRISDIEYSPNTVDTERFYLTMTDGNYVYLTINNFTRINNYIEMIKQFQNKKGILYLDSGEYFEIKN